MNLARKEGKSHCLLADGQSTSTVSNSTKFTRKVFLNQQATLIAQRAGKLNDLFCCTNARRDTGKEEQKIIIKERGKV
jgi:hypothetical protein